MRKNKLDSINARLSEMQVGPILDLLGGYVNVKELMAQARSAKGVAHGGCVAGQAVASAVQDLYFGGRGGVYNDVDCFLPTSSDKLEGVSERNRVRTVQMAQVLGDPAYGQLEASVLTRYKVLASSRQDKLNGVTYALIPVPVN